ncbi:MAG: flagellar basal body rod protein FlgC [Myxococcota bacterium]|nr:flagellar basal body rod protein FlgC [Myxococcota bacterium]
MDFFSAMEIISSGLSAERVRMNITASNLANAETTRTEAGGPYRRRDPIFAATNLESPKGFQSNLDRALQGVEVAEVVEDHEPPRLLFDPNHPDANPNGYVELPNVNMVEEMVNMMMAARSYEAGVSAMRSVVDMAQRALSVGK